MSKKIEKKVDNTLSDSMNVLAKRIEDRSWQEKFFEEQTLRKDLQQRIKEITKERNAFESRVSELNRHLQDKGKENESAFEIIRKQSIEILELKLGNLTAWQVFTILYKKVWKKIKFLLKRKNHGEL